MCKNFLFGCCAASIVLLVALGGLASAQTYFGILDGGQENPPVASPGTGIGLISYDAGTQLLGIDLSYSGLVAPTTDAHIHCCATDVSTNIGVAIGFTGAGGFVTGSTSGTYTHTFDLSQAATYSGGYLSASGGTAAQARDRLLAAFANGVENNSEVAYFNIHTSFRPGGEIRGNIIPEPSSLTLLACGVMGLMAARRGGDE